MRFFEGTPQEIVEYEHLTSSTHQAAASVDAAASPEEIINAETNSETATLSGAALTAADHVALMKFIYGRAGKNHERTVQTERFIMRLLEEEKVTVAFGRSSKTLDGLADYLMIRDDGPQRYGAVAYVRPNNGGLTVRLGPDDLEGLDLSEEDHQAIQHRSVSPSDPYKINCPLDNDASAAVAFTLVRGALQAVRSE